MTVECFHQEHTVWDMARRASSAGFWQYARRNPGDTPKTILTSPAGKPLKQMHQDKLARHLDYIQAALSRRALVQRYVEPTWPMWCSCIPDAGFASPQNHTHARRLYTKRDGLRSPPSKLNNWCWARLPFSERDTSHCFLQHPWQMSPHEIVTATRDRQGSSAAQAQT